MAKSSRNSKRDFCHFAGAKFGASLFTCVFLAGLPTLAGEANFNTATQLYQKGDQAKALLYFERSIQIQPKDAAAHYMRANCLVTLGRLDEARSEYIQAQKLAPKSQTASFAQRALNNLPASNSAQTAAASGTQSHKTGEANLPPGTLDLIRKQAEIAKQRAIDMGAANAQNERIKAANEASSLQEQLERQAMRTRTSTEPVALTPQQQEAIRAQAAAGREQLKQQGELRASLQKQESEAKAAEIDRQAENLQSQLTNYKANSNSDVKLNPVGTNLYIHNYQRAMPVVTPLKAQIKPLTGVSSTDTTGRALTDNWQINQSKTKGTSNSNSASRSSGKTQAVASVRGELVDRPKK